MSEAIPRDWIWEVMDELDSFVAKINPRGDESQELLLEDEGQVNLAWDALRPLFPTSRFRGGDVLTALELGRIFGHWEGLWAAISYSQALSDKLVTSSNQVVEIRDKIDAILAEHLPEAMKGVETGVFHLLAEINHPDFLDAVRANTRQFDVLRKSVLEFVRLQTAGEYADFMAGYGEAVASSPFDENGKPKTPDKFAQLLAILRPFAVRAGLSAGEFQSVIDSLDNSQITGHSERFAKHLQRRKAPLRGKGRPQKKSASIPKSRQKKSDNL